MAIENMIPDMTSNTTPSGVASASSVDSGNEAFHCMDRDISTHWNSALLSTSGWVQYYSPASFAATSYSLTTYSTAVSGMPKNFTLQASNTGAFSGEQVILDTQTSISWLGYEKKTFSFTNTTSYNYYRLVVGSVNGGIAISIAEFELLAEVSSISSDAIVSVVSSSAMVVNEASLNASVSVYALPKGVAVSDISVSVLSYAKARDINKAYPTAFITASSEGVRKTFDYGFQFVGEIQVSGTTQTFNLIAPIEKEVQAKIITRVNV